MNVMEAFGKFLQSEYNAEDDTWMVDAEATKTLIDFIMEYSTEDQKKKLKEMLKEEEYGEMDSSH